jgi:hypothetical protein
MLRTIDWIVPAGEGDLEEPALAPMSGARTPRRVAIDVARHCGRTRSALFCREKSRTDRVDEEQKGAYKRGWRNTMRGIWRGLRQPRKIFIVLSSTPPKLVNVERGRHDLKLVAAL